MSQGAEGADRRPYWYAWVFDLVPAMLMDFSFYLSVFAIQQILHKQQVSAVQLSTTIAVYSGGYVLACPLLASFVGERQRLSVMLGLSLGMVCMVGFRLTDGLLGYQAFLCLFAAAAALFWPQFQALIGTDCESSELSRRLSLFNLGWTVGKMGGFLLSGLLVEWLQGSVRSIFLIPLTLLLFNLCIFATRTLLFKPHKRSAPAPRNDPETEPGPRGLGVSKVFGIALVANFLVWGSQGALLAQIPVIGKALGWETWAQGALLALMIVSQFLTFTVMKRWSGWIDDRRFLFLPFILGGLSALVLPFGESLLMAVLAMACLGVASGFSYNASIYNALVNDQRFHTSIHEACLGFGSLSIPLVFGQGITRFGFTNACWQMAGLNLLMAWALWAYWTMTRGSVRVAH